MQDTKKTTDKRFQDKLLALLDWVAERDPITAAKLVTDFSEDLMREMSCGCAEPCASC